MTALIIDDNASMRENLSTLLNIYAPEIEILDEATGVKSGIEKVKSLKPELVFLDVEMNDGTGFDVLSQYGKVDFKFIFVTGHDKYAIKAFRFSAIDYILKPIDPDDLVRAVEKAKKESILETDLRTKNFIHNQSNPTIKKRIALNDANNTYLISVSDIIRCESDINYTNFHLHDGREIVISKTLKTYDEILSEYGFFRSHQSHLINLQYFDRLDKTEGGVIYLKNGDTIPISTRKRESLLSELGKL